MSKPHEEGSDRKLKRGGVAGIAIGILALLACELPIILAFVGLGGLSAGVMAFRPPEIVEIAAMVIFVIGASLLVYVFAKRLKRHRKARHP